MGGGMRPNIETTRKKLWASLWAFYFVNTDKYRFLGI